MKLTIEDIIRRAENNDFRGDFDNSLKAWSALKRAGRKCNGDSCWNCEHAEIEQGDSGSYWDPPTEDELYCTLIENGEAPELEEAAEETEYDPEFLGAFFCERYSVRAVGVCACCRTKIDAPIHKHNLWANSIDGRLAACSDKCKEQIEWEAKQYELAEAQAEAEFQRNFFD